MVLNDQAVKSATSGTLWDDSLKGFGLRTGKQSKTFIVLVASGRRKRIGRYPIISLADARTAARKILAEKTLGAVVPKHVAFDDAKRDFLADCATRLRASTIRLYKDHLDRTFPFGRKSVGDITPREILKTLKPLTPSMKEHAFRIGRTFFTWCVHQHLIDRSPMEKMEPPPLGKARERVLDDEELGKVYNTAQKALNAFHRLVYLLVRLGQRLGETSRLEASFIAPDRINLPGEITKNGQSHTFPISEETYKAIQAFPKLHDTYIFPASRSHVRGKPTTTMTGFSEAKRDFDELCGVTDWTLHDLRRTFATNMQKLGVRIEVTEALLNHVSGTKAGIVGVYQRHSYFPEMKQALVLWEEKLAHL